jgi:hypothetical protein
MAKKVAKKRVKITPRNYKKMGYDNYYKNDKGKYTFTINADDESDGEESYDENGKYLGYFD